MLTPPAALSAEHDLLAFDCGEPALDLWLKQRALNNESRFSRTYVICEGRVVAYVSISAGSVERSAAPRKHRRIAPDSVAVAIIGRLAVDRAYSGKGLGSDMLAEALRKIAAASQVLGVAAVLVQAKNEDARRFYLRHAEFLEHPAESRLLFLPVERLRAALA